MTVYAVTDNTTVQNATVDAQDTGCEVSYIDADNATTNYGTDASCWAIDRAADGTRGTWIKFDLSNIPAGKQIDSAYLYLYRWQRNFTSGDQYFELYRSVRNCVEGEVTWNNYSTGNAFTTAGGLHADDQDTTATSSTIEASSSIDVYLNVGDVTADVADFYSGAETNYGWFFRHAGGATEGTHRFRSDNGADGVRPELIITYSDASIEVTPGAGSAVLTGATPSLAVTANHTVDTGAGSAVLTGATPTLAVTASHYPAPGAGSLSISGTVPTVATTANWDIPIPVGSAQFGTYAPSLAVTDNHSLDVGVASLAFSGAVPSLSVTANWELTPGAGTMALTGQQPTVATTANHTLDVGAGSLSAQGYAPQVFGSFSVGVGAGSIAFGTYAPTVSTTENHDISVPVGSLSLDGWTPGGTNTNISTHYSQYLLRGKAPTVNVTSDITIDVPAGSLTVSPHNPGLDGFAIPQVGRATLAGYAPNVTTTASQSAIAVTTIQWSIGGGLTLWPQNVTVTIGDPIVGIGVGTGQYSFTGYAPSLAFTNTIDVAQDALAFTGQVPTVVRSFTLTDIESVSSTIVNSYGAISHIADNLISLSSPMDQYGGAATEISTIRGVYPVYSKINPGPISRRSTIAG